MAMSEMRAGVYWGEQRFAVEAVPRPRLNAGEALVKVSYAGICGTDMMIYAGKHPRARFPLIMGHEFSGIIEEAPDNSRFRPGDRVVIEPTLFCGTCAACTAGQTHVCRTSHLYGVDKNGGFAQYAAIPLDRLHAYSGQLPETSAALSEPLAVAVHTVRRSRLKVGDFAVILGCGPIGILVAMIARLSGAGQIVMTDVSPFRIAKARELGFTVLDASTCDIVKEIRDQTNGEGADVVFEVAGNQITARQMLEVARFQAQVMVVSVYKTPPLLDLARMHFTELSIHTSRCYTRNEFQQAIRFMETGAIDVSPLISHVLPIDEIAHAFELMHHPDTAMKILLHPW